MPKLPVEPDLTVLSDTEPDIRLVQPGERWFRIYYRGGAFPTWWNEMRYFGPTHSRFDHHVRDENKKPQKQNRGIVYCACNVQTCVAEVFQNGRTVDLEHKQPSLSAFEFRQTLNLLDLSSVFPLKVRTTPKFMTGTRSHARNWSQGFYDIDESIDGLYYLSSKTNKPALALYERAFNSHTFDAKLVFNRSLNDDLLREALEHVCDEIGYSLLV